MNHKHTFEQMIEGIERSAMNLRNTLIADFERSVVDLRDTMLSSNTVLCQQTLNTFMNIQRFM